MELIRARDLKAMPWKNGGGETFEILVYPSNANIDEFEWRFSMARVTRGGPFSSFPGIDRTLTVLDGGPMGLTVDKKPEILITPKSGPVSFRGDDMTYATLYGTDVTDLNVMTRRGRYGHQVKLLRLEHPHELADQIFPLLIFVQQGHLTISINNKIEHLETYDALFFDRADKQRIELSTSSHANILMVEIFDETPTTLS